MVTWNACTCFHRGYPGMTTHYLPRGKLSRISQVAHSSCRFEIQFCCAQNWTRWQIIFGRDRRRPRQRCWHTEIPLEACSTVVGRVWLTSSQRGARPLPAGRPAVFLRFTMAEWTTAVRRTHKISHSGLTRNAIATHIILTGGPWRTVRYIVPET